MAVNDVAMISDYYTQAVGSTLQSQEHYFDATVREIIDNLVLPEGVTFTVGDYGCRDGFSTQEIFGYVIDSLKERHGEQVPVHIIYEDLASNDFNALIRTVGGNGMVSADHPKVYMAICPTSFYEQCVPDNTFHLLASFWSVHCLSSSVSYNDSLFSFPDASRDEIDVVQAQARKEWQRFLLIRAKELKPGGCMMMILPAEVSGRRYGQSRVHLQNLWIAMTKVWRLLRDLRVITKSEYKAANFSSYYRSEEELRAPFSDAASQVVQAGLRIKSLEICHQEPNSMKCGVMADRETSAGRFVWTIRSWTERIFLQALSNRSRASRLDVVNSFYDRLLEHILQQDLSDCGWNNIIAYLVIVKLRAEEATVPEYQEVNKQHCA
ncbi:uncharacterized protein [Haliotis asinina]|uniref:uncharacterized protein isoform X2 n=1 Tax=Haliotis asinina TaxID=109174 RepID=UPI00353190F9